MLIRDESDLYRNALKLSSLPLPPFLFFLSDTLYCSTIENS